MPWFSAGERAPLGGCELVPLPGAIEEAEQATAVKLQAVCERFREIDGELLRSPTVVKLGGEGYLLEERALLAEDVAVVAEVVAFAGLAQRKFFLGHSSYTCRRHFDLHVEPIEAIALRHTHPRRDGSAVNIVPSRTSRIPRPPDLLPSDQRSVDAELARAMFAAAEENSAWPDIYQGVVCFNLANTDSRIVAPTTELVLLVGALERLLGATGKERSLRRKFLELFKPTTRIKPSEAPRLQSARKRADVDSVGAAWIRDLYLLRNAHAHGRLRPQHEHSWTLREHLLLASAIMPPLVKSMLARSSHYSMTDWDKAELDVFEKRLSLPSYKTPDDSNVSPWCAVMTEQLFEQVLDERRSKNGS